MVQGRTRYIKVQKSYYKAESRYAADDGIFSSASKRSVCKNRVPGSKLAAVGKGDWNEEDGAIMRAVRFYGGSDLSGWSIDHLSDA